MDLLLDWACHSCDVEDVSPPSGCASIPVWSWCWLVFLTDDERELQASATSPSGAKHPTSGQLDHNDHKQPRLNV